MLKSVRNILFVCLTLLYSADVLAAEIVLQTAQTNNNLGRSTNFYIGTALEFGGLVGGPVFSLAPNGVIGLTVRSGVENLVQNSTSFYVAGEIFLDIRGNIYNNTSFFLPTVGVLGKFGASISKTKIYGIIGLETGFFTNELITSFDFTVGYFAFDIGAGVKYMITPKIGLFTEFKSAISMMNFSSSSVALGEGSPTVLTMLFGVDFTV